MIIMIENKLLNTHLIEKMKLEFLRGVIKITYLDNCSSERRELNMKFRNRRIAKELHEAIQDAKEKGAEFFMVDGAGVSFDEKEFDGYYMHDGGRSYEICRRSLARYVVSEEDGAKEK